MFHNLCVRITTGALVLTGSAIMLGCSRQASPTTDNQAAPAAAVTPEPTSDTPPTPAAAPGSDSSSGVRMFIDKDTGDIRAPTQKELAEMAKQSAANPKSRPQAVQLPDGTVMVPMEGREQTPLQACVEDDGTLKVDHECQDAAKRSKGEQK